MTRLSLADLEANDPTAPAGKKERRFLCVHCGDAHPKDASHRSLGLNTETREYLCHRCGVCGVLLDALPQRCDPRDKRGRKLGNRRTVGNAAVMPCVTIEPSPAPKTTSGSSEGVRVPESPLKSVLEGVVPIGGTPGAEYLAGRGIPADVAHASGVRYSASFYGRPVVLFPVRDKSGTLVAVQGRRIDPQAKPKAITVGPKQTGCFATRGAIESETVILVEGPIDALSLAVSGWPAISVLGTALPDWLCWELSGRKVLVASDNDEAGEKAAAAWIAELTERGAKAARRRAEEGLDWNDTLRRYGPIVLQQDIAAMVASAWPAREELVLPVAEMTLHDFQVSGRAVRVQSELLGCEIALVADNGAAPAGVTCYRAGELTRLLGHEPDMVRLLHVCKQVFAGRIVTNNGRQETQ